MFKQFTYSWLTTIIFVIFFVGLMVCFILLETDVISNTTGWIIDGVLSGMFLLSMAIKIFAVKRIDKKRKESGFSNSSDVD